MNKKVYFIGIGGIGMSALARCYARLGSSIAGYDRTPTPLTAALESEGMQVAFEDAPGAIPQGFDGKDTLVIYTPAVGETNALLQYFRANGNEVIKRAAALGRFAKNRPLLAVAGTHGKTTTSSILAHLLTATGGGCTAFLGGIAKNYHTNTLFSAAAEAVVAEADEYDRSFLQLYPKVAVITSVDADHLDIYGSHGELLKAFQQFARQIQPEGTLICKNSVAERFAAVGCHRVLTYAGAGAGGADFYARETSVCSDGCFRFDLVTPFGVMEGCKLGAAGSVNVENAVAATAALLAYDPSLANRSEAIMQALRSFAGVQRRLDVRVNNACCVYIDDYAHHPAELAAAIGSVREMFPGRRITGVFQPHLYTRTRDFAAGFGESLSMLDELLLLPIYPAREQPMEGVTSQIILDKVTIGSKEICPKNGVLDRLRQNPPDILLTLGAGDIDTLVNPLTEWLRQ